MSDSETEASTRVASAGKGHTGTGQSSLPGPRTDVARTEQPHNVVDGEHRMNQPSSVWAYDLKLPAHASSASTARAFVGRHLVEHDLPYLMHDVQLVVSELATNAVAHAGTPFSLRLSACAHSVLLKVQDGSPHLPVQGAGAPLDTGGRGLTILNALSSGCGVTVHADGGKTVWAAFDNRRELATALGRG
jgi:anti-sigma regulatory factor (Ser/Thr protein kinase)